MPGEAPARRGEVAPERARGEDRECDEQRSRLASHEEEPPARDRRVVLGGAELLRRHGKRPRGRARLQLGPRPVGIVEERVDLPEPRCAPRQALHPAVAAVCAGEHGRRDEPGHALGHDERPRGGAVVAVRARKGRSEFRVLERVVGRCEEVAEELAGAERRRSDLHDAQARYVGELPLAPQPQHLAPLGRARAGQATGAEQDVGCEPVDRSEADERSAERRLADEDDRHGLACRKLRQRRTRLPVENAPRLVAARRDAEPGGAHRARRRGEALDVLCHAAVLRDGGADEDPGQHGGSRRDAEGRPERAAVPSPEAPEREPDDVRRAAHYRGPRALRRR